MQFSYKAHTVFAMSSPSSPPGEIYHLLSQLHHYSHTMPRATRSSSYARNTVSAPSHTLSPASEDGNVSDASAWDGIRYDVDWFLTLHLEI